MENIMDDEKRGMEKRRVEKQTKAKDGRGALKNEPFGSWVFYQTISCKLLSRHNAANVNTRHRFPKNFYLPGVDVKVSVRGHRREEQKEE
ncbi:hypothetical protein CDAR_432101 [Caerostris darwini]|uniref:Uncharacterized protein n=1 Tax=Caerostris darwini TaxID=1538125 RepID=A0AAV4U2V6_9ARAC|nr:hypothetical protein CDAR_432101 [Caerostris darwini]